jgi:hypothetical protein
MADCDVNYVAMDASIKPEQWRTIDICEIARNLHLPRPNHSGGWCVVYHYVSGGSLMATVYRPINTRCAGRPDQLASLVKMLTHKRPFDWMYQQSASAPAVNKTWNYVRPVWTKLCRCLDIRQLDRISSFWLCGLYYNWSIYFIYI